MWVGTSYYRRTTMIRIVKIRDNVPGTIRVDRASILGNPFSLKDYTLPDCIHFYTRYLRACYRGQAYADDFLRDKRLSPTWKRPTAKAVVDELTRLAIRYNRDGKLTLGCWCTNSTVADGEGSTENFSCHAEVIAWAIHRIIKKGV